MLGIMRKIIRIEAPMHNFSPDVWKLGSPNKKIFRTVEENVSFAFNKFNYNIEGSDRVKNMVTLTTNISKIEN